MSDKTCTDDIALYGDKCYIMYIYRGHLKIRHGIINQYGSFTPDDKQYHPTNNLCRLPFSYYGKNWKEVIVYNKYQYGKVIFKNESDIPKWKEFFRELYLSKLAENNAGYKKSLWTNLVEELK